MNPTFNEQIKEAKQLALNQVIRFLHTEAEYADIRDLKVATDIIKNLDETKAEDEPTNKLNVLVQNLTNKFNLPNSLEETRRLYHD